jgi:hypothetical protein
MTCSVFRSSWTCASYLLALCLMASAAAQEGTLRVRAAESEHLSSEPRQVVAATFMLTNLSRAAMEVESHIVLPAGWQPVMQPAPFALAAGESMLKLVSFTVPDGTPGGSYAVRYEARDRQHPAVSDAYGIQVAVAASMRLQVTMLELPDFAVSGDVIAGTVLLRNAGNVRTRVRFKVSGRFIASVTPAQGEVVLEPSESSRIELSIVVGKMSKRAVGRITFAATSTEASIDATNSAAFQILPRVSALDALRTLDSRVEARFVGRDSPRGRSAGFQPAVWGGGILSEERGDTLSYHIRGPDRTGSGTFGGPEEVWVRYDNQRFVAGAGDLTYGLTPLTEPGRLGRGGFVGIEGDRLGANAYGMHDEFGNGEADQIGIGARLRLEPAGLLGFNFLRRGEFGERDVDIVSLRAQAFDSSDFNLDLEAGRSFDGESRGDAWRFALHDDRHAVRYYALGWSADSRFQGPLRDKLYLSTGFDYPNPGGLGLHGYFRTQDWNLTPLEEIDPELRAQRTLYDRMRSAPTDRQASVGLGHALGSGASGTFDLVFRDRAGDTSAAQSADRESHSWRAGLHRAWRNLSLSYSLERGEGRDGNSAGQFQTSLQMLSGSLRIGRFQTYGAYWMRDENSELDPRDPLRESGGLSASFSGVGAWTLNLDSQFSRSRFGTGAIYDLAIIRQVERGARLAMFARRLEGRFARTDFSVGYSVPFGMPVMRRSDMATLRGRVYDSETSGGLANVRLRLDGAVVATDANGEFRFPAVSVGPHQIVLEHGTTDVDQVPVSVAPLTVTVSRRSSAPVAIAMVRSGAIGILVALHVEESQPLRGAPRVLVTFRKGETIFRRLTDATGGVRIGGIAPGTWNVSLAAETMPPGYQPASENIQLLVEPGETIHAEIPLMPVRRAMRMLTPLAVR